MPSKILCPHCTGRQWVTCEVCEGEGIIQTVARVSFMDSDDRKTRVCTNCHGDKTAKCMRCGGKGFL